MCVTGQLCVELFLVQQTLALGHADAGHSVAHNIQGGDEHLDGAVDGEDEGVGQQGAVIHEARAGQDGEEDDGPCAGGGRRTHRGQQSQQSDHDQLGGSNGVTGAACNEDGGHHLHDGGAVHVDGHAQRQDEGGDGLIDAEILGADLDVQGESGCAGRGGEAEDGHVGDLLNEGDGVLLCAQRHHQRIGHQQEDEEQDHRDHHIHQSGLEVINAVDGEGAGQQHEDCKGREVCDDEVQEDHHHVVHLAQQAAEGGSTALTQHIHAQAHGHGQEHRGEHCAVAAKGSDDVGGDDVEHHVQGVGAGGAGGPGEALDVGVEQAHGIGGVAHASGQCQRHKGAEQEPEEGLGRDAAHGAGIGDAADGQRDGGEDHRDDDQLQCFDEELADDVEEAERTFRALCGDVLEEQVVDGLPDAAVAGSHELFAQHHKGKACRQTANQRHRHLSCQCRAAVLIFFHTIFLTFVHFPVCFVHIRPILPRQTVGFKGKIGFSGDFFAKV